MEQQGCMELALVDHSFFRKFIVDCDIFLYVEDISLL